MRTLVSQVLVSLALLLVGAAMLQVARALPPAAERYRFGWRVAGTAILVHGINSTVHDTFNVAGFAGGPDSWAWNAVISLHPVFNHSRTFLLATGWVLLAAGLVRAHRGGRVPGPRGILAVLLAGMVAGGAVGANEAAFSGFTHFSAVAVWDLVEMLSLMTALFAGLLTARMDRALWYGLAINAFVLALNVLWFAALSWRDFSPQWTPRTWQIQQIQAVLYLGMATIAAAQARALKAGRPVRAFLDLPSRGVPSLHG